MYHPSSSSSQRGGAGEDWGGIQCGSFNKIQKWKEESCRSPLPACPTYYDCPTSSPLSALLTCQLEILRLNDLQLFDRPYFFNSFSLSLYGHFILFITFSFLVSAAYPLRFNLILHSSQTDAYYLPCCCFFLSDKWRVK